MVETHWKREGNEGLLDCVYVYMDVYTCMCTWMRGRVRDTVRCVMQTRLCIVMFPV